MESMRRRHSERIGAVDGGSKVAISGLRVRIRLGKRLPNACVGEGVRTLRSHSKLGLNR